MEPVSPPVSARSSSLGLASDENPAWFPVDLRFVIAHAYLYIYIVGLVWICPYALFTVRNRAWVTR